MERYRGHPPTDGVATISESPAPTGPAAGPLPEPPVLTALRERIDRALEAALAAPLERLRGSHPSMAPLADELAAFTAGGKRVRPALLLLGFQAAGGRQLDAVEGPALALELLHTCALLHDDVIDAAPTRRGRPTTHRAFAEQHRTAGWPGDAEAYGQAVAILLGDLAFVQADELFLAGRIPDRALLAAFRRFTVLREEVMIGQSLDLYAATAGVSDRALALEVATLKSGRYSVARPLEIGATLAGGGPEVVEGLHDVGDPLGRAFQLADDLLGVFGDSGSTGKSVSSDLAEGKRTLLIAEAEARADAGQLATLHAALGRSDLDGDTTAAVRDVLVDCGARTAVEEEIARSIEQAHHTLDRLAIDDDARTRLRAVADYLGNRSS